MPEEESESKRLNFYSLRVKPLPNLVALWKNSLGDLNPARAQNIRFNQFASSGKLQYIKAEDRKGFYQKLPLSYKTVKTAELTRIPNAAIHLCTSSDASSHAIQGLYIPSLAGQEGFYEVKTRQSNGVLEIKNRDNNKVNFLESEEVFPIGSILPIRDRDEHEAIDRFRSNLAKYANIEHKIMEEEINAALLIGRSPEDNFNHFVIYGKLIES